MEIFKSWSRRGVATVSILSLVACSSTTAVRTDTQTRIYLDGELKGTGIAYQTDSKIIGSTTSVRLEKEGCEPMYAQITRSEELDVGALIAGIILIVPLLWVMRYKADHPMEFHCTPRR